MEVGRFLRNGLYGHTQVEKLDSEIGGILWISFREEQSAAKYVLGICYLPPANSSRHVNINEFLGTLMSHVYQHQKEALVVVVRDFNIGVGGNDDFIPGVDDLCARAGLGRWTTSIR